MPVPDPATKVQVALQLPLSWGRCMIKHFKDLEALHVVSRAVLSASDMDAAPKALDVDGKVYRLHLTTRSQGRGTHGDPKFVYLTGAPCTAKSKPT